MFYWTSINMLTRVEYYKTKVILRLYNKSDTDKLKKHKETLGICPINETIYVFEISPWLYLMNPF